MLQLSQCFASNQELELVTSSGEGGSILAYTNVNMCGGGLCVGCQFILVSVGKSKLIGAPRRLPVSSVMLVFLSHTPTSSPTSEVVLAMDEGSNGGIPM